MGFDQGVWLTTAVAVESRQLYTKYRLVPRRRQKRPKMRWTLAAVGAVIVGGVIWQAGKLPGWVREVQQRWTRAAERPPAVRPPSSGPSGQTAGGNGRPVSLGPARPAGADQPAQAAAQSAPPPAPLVPPTATSAAPGPFRTRAVENVLEAQLALERRGLSPGAIDGVLGAQTRAALRAFQLQERLPASGELDPATRFRLILEDPPYTTYTITAEDVQRLTRVPNTWLAKSLLERLDYESVLELVAERFHCHPKLLRQLNPLIDWSRVDPGTTVQVPHAYLPVPRARAAFVRIRLSHRVLQAFDAGTNLLAQFPCSIARDVMKRPVGELHVVKTAANPEYTFDPANFPASLEARQLGRKLRLPPGPNNPVGTAWIGLDREGYGIHGTPHPETVGRTESLGCFRLANWNAEYLAQLVWPGMPVLVEP